MGSDTGYASLERSIAPHVAPGRSILQRSPEASVVEPLALLDALYRMHPEYQRYLMEVHSERAATFVVVLEDGSAAWVRAVFGDSGRWTLSPLY